MKKFAILGTGSSAIATAMVFEQLIKEGLIQNASIDVIDYGLLDKIKQNEITQKFNKKNTENTHVFDMPSIFQIKSDLADGLAGSSSFGGWSNIWGATIIPYSEWGLNHWGKLQAEIEFEYKFLIKKIPNLFNNTKTKISRKKSILMENQIPSSQNKIEITNLAISQFSNDKTTGCNQCGLCLEGCSSNHIWNASNQWKNIFEMNEFNYINEHWVKHISENENKVKVQCLSVGREVTLEYDRIFIGLGAIQTGALLLRSNLATEPLIVQDSAMKIVPFYRRGFKKTGEYEDRLALSEGYILTNLDSLHFKTDFFCQIYSYSKSLDEQMCFSSWIWSKIPLLIRKSLGRYIGIGMVFFDESLSEKIMINKQENNDIHVSKISNKYHFKAKLIKRMQINKAFRTHNLKPIHIMSKSVETGKGYHFGGSFPNLINDTQKFPNNYSDKLGCVKGTSRSHLIDSSCLVRVTAAPITWTTMANAARITRSVLIEYT